MLCYDTCNLEVNQVEEYKVYEAPSHKFLAYLRVLEIYILIALMKLSLSCLGSDTQSGPYEPLGIHEDL